MPDTVVYYIYMVVHYIYTAVLACVKSINRLPGFTESSHLAWEEYLIKCSNCSFKYLWNLSVSELMTSSVMHDSFITQSLMVSKTCKIICFNVIFRSTENTFDYFLGTIFLLNIYLLNDHYRNNWKFGITIPHDALWPTQHSLQSDHL